MIKFKIVEVYPKEHSIVVRYYTDILSEFDLGGQVDAEGKLMLKEDGSVLRCRTDIALDLPIPAPVGEELDKFILSRCNVDWFNKMEAVVDPNIDTSMTDLIALIGVEKQGEIAPFVPSHNINDAEKLRRVEITAIIQNVIGDMANETI